MITAVILFFNFKVNILVLGGKSCQPLSGGKSVRNVYKNISVLSSETQNSLQGYFLFSFLEEKKNNFYVYFCFSAYFRFNYEIWLYKTNNCDLKKKNENKKNILTP